MAGRTNRSTVADGELIVHYPERHCIASGNRRCAAGREQAALGPDTNCAWSSLSRRIDTFPGSLGRPVDVTCRSTDLDVGSSTATYWLQDTEALGASVYTSSR